MEQIRPGLSRLSDQKEKVGLAWPYFSNPSFQQSPLNGIHNGNEKEGYIEMHGDDSRKQTGSRRTFHEGRHVV